MKKVINTISYLRMRVIIKNIIINRKRGKLKD